MSWQIEVTCSEFMPTALRYLFLFFVNLCSISFSPLMLLVGWPVKIEWWGVGIGICLGQVADLHMARLMPLPPTVSCFSKIQIGFTFLVPAHPVSPRQKAVKRVLLLCSMVCSCISQFMPSYSSSVIEQMMFVRLLMLCCL